MTNLEINHQGSVNISEGISYKIHLLDTTRIEDPNNGITSLDAFNFTLIINSVNYEFTIGTFLSKISLYDKNNSTFQFDESRTDIIFLNESMGSDVNNFNYQLTFVQESENYFLLVSSNELLNEQPKTIHQILQELHSIPDKSELSSKYTTIKQELFDLINSENDYSFNKNYYVNHVGREFFKKAKTLNAEELIKDEYDSGGRPLGFNFIFENITPTPTPSNSAIPITPTTSVTVTPTATISPSGVAPTVTPTASVTVTPSISISPSGEAPTVTPTSSSQVAASPSVTPSLTPTVTPIMTPHAFTTKEELEDAVQLWFSDEDSSNNTYGQINTWNVSQITDMSYLFDTKLKSNTTLDLSNWDVSNVTDMSYMFTSQYGRCYLILDNWDTSSVTNMEGMFYDAFFVKGFSDPYPFVSFNNWDTSNVTNMSKMFGAGGGAGNQLLPTDDFSFLDTSSVTNMSEMFQYRNFVQNFSNANVFNSLNVSSVTNMSSMFKGVRVYNTDPDNNTTSLNLNYWNVSSVTDMSFMFSECGFGTINLGSWNSSSVTTMEEMFFASPSWGAIHSLVFSSFDTSSVQNMSQMFRYSIFSSLDLSNFNTSSVNNMYRMFRDCKSLSSLNLSNWNTTSVTNMVGMFNFSSSLTSLDLSSFNTSNVTSMGGMFYGCTGLTTLNLGNNWHTNKVTNTNSMFADCTALTSVDVSSWDVRLVTDMNYMFENCSNIINNNIDFSSWCVSHISSKPFNFNSGAGFTEGPSWGQACVTISPSVTPTASVTITPTVTISPSGVAPTVTPTASVTVTPTATISPSGVAPTVTPTASVTVTPTATISPSGVAPTVTPTASVTVTPTVTISPSGVAPTPSITPSISRILDSSPDANINFNITNNSNDPQFDSVDYVNTIQRAVDHWDRIIVGQPFSNWNLKLNVTFDTLDQDVLGGAGIKTFLTSATNFPLPFGDFFPNEANIILNTLYLSGMQNNTGNAGTNELEYVFKHEAGHALGIGGLILSQNGAIDGEPVASYVEDGVTKYYYTGQHAFQAYKDYLEPLGYNVSQLSGIPIEDDGGNGTANAHPEEGVTANGSISTNDRTIGGVFHPGLEHELMAGWSEGGNYNPLSKISIGFLHDMGFNVDYNEADPYNPEDPLFGI